MWYLKHISATDICSFRTLDYAPAEGTTTLIFGHNADNESQRSNGAGKSTLIEAITLGLTGSPLRKVRAEEVVNDAAEECRVTLTLGNRATGERCASSVPYPAVVRLRCDACSRRTGKPER